MQPYAEGQALASAVVAMAIFFVFAAWSGANLMKTKCKLYEVLLVSALGKPAALLQARSACKLAPRIHRPGVGRSSRLLWHPLPFY